MGWLARRVIAHDLFRHQQVLVGDRVRLEPLGPHVLEPYLRMLADPEGRELTGTHAEFTVEQTVAWLRTRSEQHDRADWAAVEPGTGTFLGEAVLNDLDADNESIGFRIALAGPEVYGRGFGTEINRLVVDHALDDLGLHRIELEVFDTNPRAQRVYEKCGFVVEGRRRDALLWNGVRHDIVTMAILRTDLRPGRVTPGRSARRRSRPTAPTSGSPPPGCAEPPTRNSPGTGDAVGRPEERRAGAVARRAVDRRRRGCRCRRSRSAGVRISRHSTPVRTSSPGGHHVEHPVGVRVGRARARPSRRRAAPGRAAAR